jgi:acetyl-CoA carboxylase biotin carboxyl carrier protein
MTDIPAQDVEALVRIFDESDWDELRVVVGGTEIYLSKNPGDRLQPASAAALPQSDGRAASPAVAVAAAVPARKPAAQAIPDGVGVVRAPNLGTFYRAPKPGAPPYVAVGQKVEAATEVCLIEVMKLFTSVRAGVAGTVREVLAEDAQLVEFDQPLFLIEPPA